MLVNNGEKECVCVCVCVWERVRERCYQSFEAGTIWYKCRTQYVSFPEHNHLKKSFSLKPTNNEWSWDVLSEKL